MNYVLFLQTSGNQFFHSHCSISSCSEFPFKIFFLSYVIFQELQEPEGDVNVFDEEFGGQKVLAVVRPPTHQLQTQVSMSVSTYRLICRAYFLLKLLYL